MHNSKDQFFFFDWLKYVYALVERKLHKLNNNALLIVGFNGYSPSLQLCYWRDSHPGVANTFWTAVYAFSLLHTIDCVAIWSTLLCVNLSLTKNCGSPADRTQQKAGKTAGNKIEVLCKQN